jgi:uncharacterized protein (UPF0254 family)
MEEIIRVATAECFTHGFVAREIHAAACGYKGSFGPKILKAPDNKKIVVLCSVFVPTLSGLRSLLKIKPPAPIKTIRGIKAYDEDTDKKVAVLMAESIRKIARADIGIGTTAGIGRGGIAISTEEFTIQTTSDEYADLTTSDSDQLLRRQKSGIKKTLYLFESVITDKIDEPMLKTE